MSSVLRNLVPAALSLVVACTAAGPSAPPGFMEGHVKIVSPREVQLADGGAPTIAPEVYAEYPLIILGPDGKVEIAPVTVDAEGNYRAALPPGDYVLDVQGRSRGHIRAQPRRFRVVSGQTVHVDMEIDTGVR